NISRCNRCHFNSNDLSVGSSSRLALDQFADRYSSWVRKHMLNLFSITVVLTRFFAVYMLVSATFSIPTAMTLIKQTESASRFTSDTVILIAIGVAYVTVAALLFSCAKRFAGYVTRGLDSPSLEISENHLTLLQSVAFSILGAYVLTYAIP